MKYQSLQTAKKIIRKYLKDSPHAKILTLFLNLRKKTSLSYFGDYPLFATVISELRNKNVLVDPASIRKAISVSNELKGKESILNALLNE